ncbi:MAG TPA: rhodanese-like domain-containing protein [Xanthomonadales bacterium]|nr:rhodanese-like domain-containing protein [Xanthomonadales bacterium]
MKTLNQWVASAAGQHMKSARFMLVSLVLMLAACSSVPKTQPVTWIDVRSPEEFAQQHVAQASNIPYTEIVPGVEQLNLDKDAPIYLYCGSGRRAGLALEALQAEGYTNLTNLGGLDAALEKAGQSRSP